jgi:hypothetical protein
MEKTVQGEKFVMQPIHVNIEVVKHDCMSKNLETQGKKEITSCLGTNLT